MEKQGKTPIEWSAYLPEPIRTQFLENIDPSYVDYSEHTDSLDDCIVSAFSWGDTLDKGQGFIHWDRIHERALNGEFNQVFFQTEETKQETLEEAADKYLKENNGNSMSVLQGFIEGAKWQLEQINKQFKTITQND